MTSAEKKKIATWIIVPLMAFICLFDIASVVLGTILTSRVPISPEPFEDRPHPLSQHRQFRRDPP